MKNSLKNKKDITNLFENGKKTVVGKVMIIRASGTDGFLFTVSKKKFKNAVDRNRIKRLMREAVKGISPKGSIGLVYIGTEMPKSINITL